MRHSSESCAGVSRLIAMAIFFGTSASATAVHAQQNTADDSQLPAYLQDDPNAEAEGAIPDPWERYNRHIYHFNKKLDDHVARPLALAYQRIVPGPARAGVSNFFKNLHEPLNTANLLLQGHPGFSAASLGRFLVNTTVGIGGLFDPATAAHIPDTDEDFGLTLAHWGWKGSRYFLLPFLGPGTVRDRIGSLVDYRIGPYRYIQHDRTRIALTSLSLVNMRAQLLPLDNLSQGMDDDYRLVRDAWGQHRNHQIHASDAPTSASAPPAGRR